VSGPLDLTPAEMRALGYAAVDAVVAHLEGLGTGPVVTPPPADLAARLDEPPPEAGTDPVALLAVVREQILASGVRTQHPAMLAYIPIAATFPGAVGDLMAAGVNVFAGSYQSGPGAAEIELLVLRWFRDLLGLDPGADGVVVGGGSVANLVGLAVARERRPAGGVDRVAYVTSESHSSVGRALRVLGMTRVCTVEVDERFRMRPDGLVRAMDADAAAGRTPWCVIAAAGSTNTGAVDDLPALAAVCAERGAWLHVDGAYGGFLALTERGRAAMPGLELADTLVLDAHKSLYCPVTSGIVYARDGRDLERAFAVRPDYLKDIDRAGGVNFADRGIELSRPFRALKIWMTVKTFGLARIREALTRSLDLADLAAEHVARSDRLEAAAPHSLGVVTFRSSGGIAAERLVEAVAAAGGMIGSTSVAGEPAARLCVLGHRTDEAAVTAVMSAAESAQ
jgi:aromatic-L-amino-acid decarboxylase